MLPLCLCLKGHSQLAHMRIRYPFMANLHITETRSMVFLTKYDKNNITGWAKAPLKQVFQWTIENQAKHYQNWSGILDVLWFQVGVNSHQNEKTSVQASPVPKLTVSSRQTFNTKMSSICMKVNLLGEHIVVWMVSYEDSFWNRGTGNLEITYQQKSRGL